MSRINTIRSNAQAPTNHNGIDRKNLSSCEKSLQSLVENPLPRFKAIYHKVSKARQTALLQNKLTWIGMVKKVNVIAPDIFETYNQRTEEIDMNIYGKYSAGTLTQEELDEFYNKLKSWRQINYAMFELFNK